MSSWAGADNMVVGWAQSTRRRVAHSSPGGNLVHCIGNTRDTGVQQGPVTGRSHLRSISYQVDMVICRSWLITGAVEQAAPDYEERQQFDR